MVSLSSVMWSERPRSQLHHVAVIFIAIFLVVPVHAKDSIKDDARQINGKVHYSGPMLAHSPFRPPKPVSFYSKVPSHNSESFHRELSEQRPAREREVSVAGNHPSASTNVYSILTSIVKANEEAQNWSSDNKSGHNTNRRSSQNIRYGIEQVKQTPNRSKAQGRLNNSTFRSERKLSRSPPISKPKIGLSYTNINAAASRGGFVGDTGRKSPIKPEVFAGPIQTKPRPETAGSQEAPPEATLGLLTSHPHGRPRKHIFCYYGSSANSRPSVGKFWPENIDPFLCTHLIFAFVDISEDGTDIKPNNWNDLGPNGLYKRTIDLKQKNRDLKVLLAVGGWKIGSKPFLPVIESRETWLVWISNVIDYLRRFGFDGLDMDWEFPGWRGSGPQDRHKFTLFMKDIYEAFADEAASTGRPRLLLTLATASSAFYVEKAYEPTEIHKYIDYMLLMTYNFHGSGWEKATGHHTPLLPHPLDPPGEQRELYVLWAINYWLNFGVPRSKLVMGMASYGLGWKLTDLSQTGVRAPADGGNTRGKYTEESGILSHYEICEHVIQDGWRVEWIDEQKVPYAYGEGEWVGFDSPDSYFIKAVTILQEDLAGAFVWSVEMDDFSGHCGGPKYPLLRTVYEVFTESPLAVSSSASARLQLGSRNVGLAAGASAAAKVPHGAITNQHHGRDTIPNVQPNPHQNPAAHHTPQTGHHNGEISNDYHYAYDPDSDGHLSKPWQANTNYDYEYYSWDAGDDSSAHASAAASGDHFAHYTGQEGNTPNQNHHSESLVNYDTGIYHHNPDADGHISKPWQAHSDYDYEYYDWGIDTPRVSHITEYNHDYDQRVGQQQLYDEYHEHNHDQEEYLKAVNCGALGVGIHSSPHSCHHFVICVPVFGHELGPSLMTCPSGTLYDESLKVCNHQHLVECKR